MNPHVTFDGNFITQIDDIVEVFEESLRSFKNSTTGAMVSRTRCCFLDPPVELVTRSTQKYLSQLLC